MPFKNILIPIDETMDAEVAVNRAMKMGDPSALTNVHLILINKKSPLSELINPGKNHFRYKIRERERQAKLSVIFGLRDEIEQQSNNRWTVIIETFSGNNVSNALIEYNERNNIDLFINSIREKHPLYSLFSGINVNKIARYSKCTILTVTQGCLNHPVKLILLPVSTSVPERKIQIAIEFARKNNGHVHLVTWLEGNDDMSAKTRIDAFYKTYKILKECGYPPQYKILSGFDSREVLLQYAYRVNADLILLSSGNESFIKGLIKKTITNLLQPLSALHVMMLHPTI